MKKSITVLFTFFLLLSCGKSEIKTVEIEKEISIKNEKTIKNLQKISDTELTEKCLETLNKTEYITNNLKYLSNVEYANLIKLELFKVYEILDDISTISHKINTMSYNGIKLFDKKQIININKALITFLEKVDLDLYKIKQIILKKEKENYIDNIHIEKKATEMKYKLKSITNIIN